MRTLTIGICANLKKDVETLIGYFENAETSLERTIDFKTFTNHRVLLRNYHYIYDMIFIILPFSNADADTFLKELREVDPDVSIVLISDSGNYYQLGYKYKALNYLTKPLGYAKILNEISTHLMEEDLISRPYFWISNHKGQFKVYLYKLRYIETGYRRLDFYYGKNHLYQMGRLMDFEQTLPQDSFFRCHNSYIVNINYIEKIFPQDNRYSLRLTTGEILPLSRPKKRELQKLLQTLKK